MKACENDRNEYIPLFLLEAKMVDKEGQTALMIAAKRVNVEAVQ